MRPGASGGATRGRGAGADPETRRDGGDTGHVTSTGDGKWPEMNYYVNEVDMDISYCLGGDTPPPQAAPTQIIPPESRIKNQRRQRLKDLQKLRDKGAC